MTASRKKEKLPMAQILGMDEKAHAVNRKLAEGAEPFTAPIVISRYEHDDSVAHHYPRARPEYVFPSLDESKGDGSVSATKLLALAMERGMTAYVYGPHGSGKSQLVLQYAQRTNRPLVRFIHQGSMDAATVLGTPSVSKEHGIWFNPGLLPLAVKYGYVYLADEYDYSDPSINSVYQAVLEGEPLVIPEACAAMSESNKGLPPEAYVDWRHVEPHPDFRFVATGNTNGQGDQTGLYSGTNIGNAANYSRFAVTMKVDYLEAAQEIDVLTSSTHLRKEDAANFVRWANIVRGRTSDRSEDNVDVMLPVSTRELVNIVDTSLALMDFTAGVKASYTERLNPSDAMAALSIFQRIFSV